MLTHADPDMLEVGNMATFEEDRAHFGAWCVVSSPLVLGYDVTDSSVTEKVWPILSNRQAVQVNQQYAGHPGRLVKAWDVVPPAPAPPGCGYLVAGSCSNPKAAAKGWATGIPLGLAIRGVGKGQIPPKPFVVVAMVATGAFLVGWRAWFAKGGSNKGGNKQGNPLAFMNLLMSLTKRR